MGACRADNLPYAQNVPSAGQKGAERLSYILHGLFQRVRGYGHHNKRVLSGNGHKSQLLLSVQRQGS